MQQITVGKMFEEWLEVYVKPCKKENTYLCYKNVITMIKKFRPKLVDRSIRSVMEYDLQKLLNDAAKKYSKSTLKKMQIVFKAAYERAISNKICKDNPACGLTIPDATVKKVRALTRTEETAVRTAAKEDRLGHIAIFFLDTGIRSCELTGLKWNAYNPEKHEIYIFKSKTRRGIRTVPLIQEAETIIQNQPHRCEYIFASAKGTPITKTVLKRLYERLREKTGIKIITNHVYRHSFATRMIERGADYKALSQILGHASVDFTLDTYADAETEFLHEQISVLEKPHKRRLYKIKKLSLKPYRT
jgi:integrase